MVSSLPRGSGGSTVDAATFEDSESARGSLLARLEGLPQLRFALLARPHHVAHALLLDDTGPDLAAALLEHLGHVGDLLSAGLEERRLAGGPEELVAPDEPVLELLLRLLRHVRRPRGRGLAVDQEVLRADLHLGLARP